MSRRQKILIAGGALQIGEFVIQELKEKDEIYDIRMLDMREPKGKRVEFLSRRLDLVA